MTVSITCPRCGRTSYNANDIAQKYCGACHQFHEFMPFEYTCRACGGTFVSARPDAIAHDEAEAIFGRRGDHPTMAMVCHDCWLKVMEFARRDQKHHS